MKVLVLGAGVDQLEMIKKSKELGYIVYAADRVENPIGKDYADVFINIDPRNTVELEHIIHKEEIKGICTMASNLIPRYVSEISEKCGLKSISYEASILATDKEKFKRVFLKQNIATVNGGVAKDKKDALEVCENLQFPVIFKPADGSGCKGIRIVKDIDEVDFNFEQSLAQSETKTIIIEEFLENDLVFGVESLINNNKTFVIGIADKIVSKTSVINTIGVTMPTVLQKEEIDKVKEIVEDIHKELRIDMGASHIDFILHNGIPKVIDIGPRLAGGPLIFELIQKTKNVDMIKFIVEQSIGQTPDPIVSENELSAVSLHFFSPVSGELLGYNTPDLHQNMTMSWRKKKGDYLAKYGSNIERLGYLTCIDVSVDRAKEKIINIINNIEITIRQVDGSIGNVSPIVPSNFL